MAKQLVLSGNKVIAHGEDCFAVYGNVVYCADTDRVFYNATVAECTTECPPDIDDIGYEYHAGVFVPYGTPSEYVAKTFHTSYEGTGTNTVSIICGFRPKMAIVKGSYKRSLTGYPTTTNVSKQCILGEGYSGDDGKITVTMSDTGITWTATNEVTAFNIPEGHSSEVEGNLASYYDVKYDIIIFG